MITAQECRASVRTLMKNKLNNILIEIEVQVRAVLSKNIVDYIEYRYPSSLTNRELDWLIRIIETDFSFVVNKLNNSSIKIEW